MERRTASGSQIAAPKSRGKIRRFITIAILGVFWLFSANAVLADNSGLCRASDGRYLTGRVIQGPNFVMGHSRDGVELSHSHIILQADKDGQLYDVAIDNIFASGYDSAGETVPAPLSSIAVGDRLELCGALYRHGGLGIHGFIPIAASRQHFGDLTDGSKF